MRIVIILAALLGAVNTSLMCIHPPENENRVEAARQHVQPALGEHFGKAVFIRIIKEDKAFELWVQEKDGHWHLLKTYEIAGMSGTCGPKTAEGDPWVVGIQDPDHAQGSVPLGVVELKKDIPAEQKETIRKEILQMCDELLEERGKPSDVTFIDEMLHTALAKHDYRALDAGHEYIKEQILGALTITDEGLLGDANSDGVVDYVDAIYVLEYDAKLRAADELALHLCDVNGDGAVDYVDAIFILEYDAKLITKFPAAV